MSGGSAGGGGARWSSADESRGAGVWAPSPCCARLPPVWVTAFAPGHPRPWLSWTVAIGQETGGPDTPAGHRWSLLRDTPQGQLPRRWGLCALGLGLMATPWPSGLRFHGAGWSSQDRGERLLRPRTFPGPLHYAPRPSRPPDSRRVSVRPWVPSQAGPHPPALPQTRDSPLLSLTHTWRLGATHFCERIHRL